MVSAYDKLSFDHALPAAISIVAEIVGSNAVADGSVIFVRDVVGAIAVVIRNRELLTFTAQLEARLSELRPYVDDPAIAWIDDLPDERLAGIAPGLKEIVRGSDGVQLEARLIDQRIVGADWQRAPLPPIDKTPVVVFWSLKGGVGRSTALCVSAAALAEAGLNVLALDLDLEAPGLGDMLLNEEDRPRFGTLDFYIENGLGRVDSGFLNQMIAPSRLTGRGGIVSVVPAIGVATDASPQNMLAKLARSYTDKIGHGTFLDQTRELLTKLSELGNHDVILVDARAGLNEGTAASILGLGGLVLLFGIDTPQTFRGYRYAFAHLRRFLEDNFEQDWRTRLQMVHAKSSLSEVSRKSFRDRAYNLYSDWIYDEASFDDIEAFNFDMDDGSAPHFGWPILHDSDFLEFDPVARPELLQNRLTDRTFGEFIDRLKDEISR